MKRQLLIIEDEDVIREGVMAFLSDKGYLIDGKDSISHISEINVDHYDLLILDVMLPKLDGFTILKQIRQVSNIPILMLTALSSDYDQIKLFELLCDDYLAKPFSLVVLEKRIQALFRRTASPNKWRYQDVVVIFDQFKAYKNNDEVNLTA
ncbi:response regulator transcription factor, partial [Streptococcus merionis]